MSSPSVARAHVYTTPASALDSARFIAASLLVSHGLRPYALAAARVGDRWVIARGDRVRHLRPDEDSLEGWIRAVLRGSPLGALVAPALPESPRPVVCIDESGRDAMLALLEIGEPVTLTYGASLELCDYRLRVGLELPAFLQAAIANVLLDNWRALRRARL
ncbi:MAG: hypothetical protein QXS85_01325 [Acidilobaceae archaeon]